MLTFLLSSFFSTIKGFTMYENFWFMLGSYFLNLSILFAEVNVPVVGGHAGITILPLFSQVYLFY